MKTIGKFVVIQPENEDLKTDFGFSIGEDGAKDIRYRNGLILSVGTLVDPKVEEGLRVKYDKHAGHDMMIGGVTVKVILEGNIVTVLEEGE